MTSIPKKEEKIYTYEDYSARDDDVRYEIIDGIAYSMSPVPHWKHQAISGNLFNEFGNYLKGHKCRVFHAPLDVLLISENEDINNVKNIVQPDILIVCDKNKLSDKGVIGAPDLIIEITSPSTSSKDFIKKRDLYCKYGVKEYWIIDTANELVWVYIFGENKDLIKYNTYSKEDKVTVGLFPELEIDSNNIFAE